MLKPVLNPLGFINGILQGPGIKRFARIHFSDELTLHCLTNP